MASHPRPFVAFRMPTAENLIPIRLDLEFEGRKLKDAFTWNAEGALGLSADVVKILFSSSWSSSSGQPRGSLDYNVNAAFQRLVKESNLPAVFQPYIAQSMQTQLTEFRSYEGQEMSTEEKVQIIKLEVRCNNILIHDQFLWDVNNFSSDPEDFARGLCKDLEIEDPEVALAIAVAIREQLYEISKQNLASGRETRISKKVRRDKGGVEYYQSSVQATTALNMMKRPSSKTSIVSWIKELGDALFQKSTMGIVRRNEWDHYEPVVEILTDKEVEALYAREVRNARLKKRQEESDDAYGSRYLRV